MWDDQARAKNAILEDGNKAQWVDGIVAATGAAYGKPTPAAIEEMCGSAEGN